jgi:hypothetical protein
MTARQKWSLLVLSITAAVATVVPAALVWDQLPDSIATHWDLSGNPNGHMPPSVLFIGVLVVLVAVTWSVWGASRRIPAEARSFIAGAAGFGGLMFTLLWLTFEINRGVADWTAAGGFTVIHLVVVIAAALMAGTIGWIAAGPAVPLAPGHHPHANGPVIPVAPGTDPVWSGRGRGPVIIVIGVVLVGIAVAVWSAVSLLLVVAAIPVMVFSEVRTTVSRRGVVVSLGWLGIPHWLVPMADVTGAEVEVVSPLSYGGWGYRARPGARAVVVRGGSSLRIHRSHRPDLVLTVDDAERGASLINGLVAAG